ncbi:DUF4931 domain-containing protein [Candidatus Saccharibacteria bacterium]|nr:DUF4931 domain-containing protein [Candidatus Saccharibacteria bacterium]
MKPEIRKDYFKDEYVIIAPGRGNRPHKTINAPDPVGVCHFCPDGMHHEKVTYHDNGRTGEWEIISVINKFAALEPDNHSAYGQSEVIIETRRHGMNLSEFSVDHIVRIFNAYIHRYDALRAMPGVKHVIVFKNEGGRAGASIPHSHSQIMALPILPPKIEKEAREYNKYYLENDSCPYCDIIKLETGRPRFIWEDKHLFVLAPYASDCPYGAWLIPKRHIRRISDLTHSEKESIAMALKIVLGKMDEMGVSYNYFIENSVNGEDYHMHIKIAPRPNIWAGLELGTGVIINPVPPEEAAKLYRGQIELDNKIES